MKSTEEVKRKEEEEQKKNRYVHANTIHRESPNGKKTN